MMENDERIQEEYDLRVRIAMCKFCIQTLEQTVDDPRQPDALRHYQGQMAELEAKLAQLQSKPPDIVIGLKPAELFPRVPK